MYCPSWGRGATTLHWMQPGDAAKHPSVHSTGPPPLSPPTPATKNCLAPVSMVLWETKLVQTYPFMPVFVVFRKARFQVTRRTQTQHFCYFLCSVKVVAGVYVFDCSRTTGKS